MVERKLKSKKIQRAIIDVRPVWIEGKAYNYYHAKEGYIEAYGETETVNNNEIDFSKLSKWNQ
jgi:Tfp pilus assembly major pilin PilA